VADIVTGMTRLDPAWRRAPLVLLRFPAVLSAILLTAFILGLAAGSGPLFLASGANAAFAHELALLEPRHAGFSVELQAAADPPGFSALDQRLRDELSAPGVLGEPTVTLLGSPVRIAGDDVRVRLIARTGAVAALTPVSGSQGSSGVWLAQRVASALDLAAGDETFVRFSDTDVPVRVAGVYADFSDEQLGPYWSQIANLIIARETGAAIEPPPPPLAVMETDELLRTAAAMGASQLASWEFPL
jgi:hypothetical protein